jgi:hypothetical protein
MAREKAALGVFLTLNPPTRKTEREACAAGFYMKMPKLNARPAITNVLFALWPERYGTSSFRYDPFSCIAQACWSTVCTSLRCDRRISGTRSSLLGDADFASKFLGFE